MGEKLWVAPNPCLSQWIFHAAPGVTGGCNVGQNDGVGVDVSGEHCAPVLEVFGDKGIGSLLEYPCIQSNDFFSGNMSV